MISNVNKAVIKFFEKGYTIDSHGIVRNKKGKEVKGSVTSKTGYRRTPIREAEFRADCFFHKAQAYKKFGSIIFNKGVQVRHLNGNPLDNSWKNILIGDGSSNQMDIPVNIRKSRAAKANQVSKRYTTKYNANKVKAFYLNNKSYKKTMEKFGITSKGTLHGILNR